MMISKEKLKIALISALIFVFFIPSATLFAQDNGNEITNTLTEPEEETPEPLDEKTIKKLQFIQEIRNQIRASNKDLFDISQNVKDADDRLGDVHKKVVTLSEQLANLNNQIKTTEDLILNVTIQIGETENELLILFDEMEVKKVALDYQKQMLMDYLGALYEQESSVANTINSNQTVNTAKLLLSDETVGEQLQKLKYLNILEDTGHEIFDQLEYLLNELEEDQVELEQEKEKLAGLYMRLEKEKYILDIQRKAKEKLLEQTKGEEDIYRQLLEESKRQQEQIKEDIEILQENLAFIRTKMEELGEDFDPDDYRDILNRASTSVYEYINSTKGDNSEFALRWPVSPSRGISAYFRDPSYVAVFGFAHNAVDIRVPQGTPIRAPEDGIVYKAQDNNYGYSYIIVAHKGGYMTVYGHVNELRVEAGEKVYAGQIIGLSGGIPGTKGAGLMTTGAHLHFEVMQGGKYVDPLDYLPLIFLPFDTLPDKYRSRITDEKIKVSRLAEYAQKARNAEELIRMIELGENAGNNTTGVSR